MQTTTINDVMEIEGQGVESSPSPENMSIEKKHGSSPEQSEAEKEKNLFKNSRTLTNKFANLKSAGKQNLAAEVSKEELKKMKEFEEFDSRGIFLPFRR